MIMENQEKYLNRIRGTYGERSETKLDELRRADKKAKLPARIFAYTFGTVGTLVLGTGMCLALKAIGATLSFAMPLGIVIGVLGIGMVSANYFIYKAIMKARKKKYSARILALSDELMNG